MGSVETCSSIPAQCGLTARRSYIFKRTGASGRRQLACGPRGPGDPDQPRPAAARLTRGQPVHGNTMVPNVRNQDHMLKILKIDLSSMTLRTTRNVSHSGYNSVVLVLRS